MTHDEAVNKFLDEYDQIVEDAACWRELILLAQDRRYIRPFAEEAAKNALAKRVASATVKVE